MSCKDNHSPPTTNRLMPSQSPSSGHLERQSTALPSDFYLYHQFSLLSMMLQERNIPLGLDYDPSQLLVHSRSTC